MLTAFADTRGWSLLPRDVIVGHRCVGCQSRAPVRVQPKSARAVFKYGRAMVVVLYIFAALEFIGGIGVVVVSKDAIRELVGTVLVGFSIITAGLGGTLAEILWSRKLLERQVGWSRKLLEVQMAQGGKSFEDQRPQTAAQVDTPATYRGYQLSCRRKRGGAQTQRWRGETLLK